jgi:hypothetical protein
VLSFAGLAEVVKRAWENTWEAIGRGAELQALANATGQTVDQLYRLEHALGAIGSQANPQMLLLMTQKALSGINEQGMRTDVLFTRLGLNFQKLRSEDTVQAMTEIAGAMGKLNANQSAGVAESLFGRFNAATFLQMSRNMEGFQKGFSASSETGALLDKFSKTFEQVKADWADIENDVLGIWVAIAGQIAPLLHHLMEEVHTFSSGIVRAFADGKIGEVLKLSLLVACEYAASFISGLLGSPALWRGVFEVMTASFMAQLGAVEALFMTLIAAIKTSLDWLVANFAAAFGDKIALILAQLGKAMVKVNPVLGGALEVAGAGMMAEFGLHGGSTDWNKQFNHNLGQMNDAMGGFSPDNLFGGSAAMGKMGLTDMKSALQDAMKNANAADLPNLKKLLASLPETATSSSKAGGDTTIAGVGESHWKPEFTSLEKMGFIMSSGGRMDGEQQKIGLLHRIAAAVEKPRTSDEPTSQIFNKSVTHP